MNTVNPTALLRSLIVYAICVPLAVIVGYALVNLTNANFQDVSSLGMIGVLVAVLVFPLLMRWHYPLMFFSWSLPVTMFFLPGRPSLYLVMVTISLTISVIERILDRNKRFLPTGGVVWPLLAFLAVIAITAKLNGGFGLKSMGSDVYGGKKYIYLIVGILSFFAIIARPIPKTHARLYMTLYFSGAFFNAFSDFFAYVPEQLHFLYLIIPPETYGTDLSGQSHVEIGVTRLSGIASAAGAAFIWMISRNGLRGNFLSGKLWRPLLMGILAVLIGLGGFRGMIIGPFLLLVVLFYLERLYRTGALLVVLMAAVVGGSLLVPLAPHLPFTFQRTIAFLPLDISADARLDAEASTEWRLEMWQALWPKVPQYLLLGKGFAFSAETFNESMGSNATFQNHIDASQDPLALSSDFHSGPLSLVIPLGIWGVLVWLWYWAAGFFVVWRNYRYGDPALGAINRFLFAWFACKCFFFVFIFGGVVEDVGAFAGIIGLSIALNHGVMRHPPVARSLPEQPIGRNPAPLVPER
jgi:hypothetical protein